MDAQSILNVIFGCLMAMVLLIGIIFLLARAHDGEWETIIGAATGAIMMASLYGIYVLWNLLNK